MSRRSRRRFLQGSIAVAGLAVASGCGTLPWQASPKIPRVGYLDGGFTVPTIEPFRAGLQELGYVEGQNIIVEDKNGQAVFSRMPEMVAELVAEPVDVIVARGPQGARFAMQATKTIPIVAAGSDIVGAGFVSNVAHPEGNITGVTTSSAEFAGKWLDILKETVPTLSRPAAIVDLGNDPVAQGNWKSVQQGARALDLNIKPYDLRDLKSLPTLLEAARAEGADGVVLLSGGTLTAVTLPQIGQAALASGLPTISLSREFADSGGLLAYGPNNDALIKQSARLVDRILKGARVSDVPVEKPTTFDFVINLKTARTLGLTVPRSVLAQATGIVE